jgi:RNA polymerase sigma-70 factor (subfamily 1)
MSVSIDAVNRALGEYRAYLETLTFIQMDPRLRSKISMSDIVQKTLVEAWCAVQRIEALDAPGRKRWLRKMLVNNLLDEIRRWLRLPPEQALEFAANESSFRLQDWLGAEETPPIDRLERQEKKLRVLEALSQLPEREREALILQQYHGWKLDQIAEHLKCTTNAVAGLQARGRARLREPLGDLE